MVMIVNDKEENKTITQTRGVSFNTGFWDSRSGDKGNFLSLRRPQGPLYAHTCHLLRLVFRRTTRKVASPNLSPQALETQTIAAQEHVVHSWNVPWISCAATTVDCQNHVSFVVGSRCKAPSRNSKEEPTQKTVWVVRGSRLCPKKSTMQGSARPQDMSCLQY